MRPFSIVALLLPLVLIVYVCWGVTKNSSLFYRGLGRQHLPLIPTPAKEVIGISDSSLTVEISKAIDGDTIQTSTGQKIRYIGINAPEALQPYGQEATDFNIHMVVGKRVHVTYDQQQKDQYGRILGYVSIGSVFVNLEMVKKGWALAESIPPDTLHQQDFENAEKAAKSSCRGLWSDLCMPVSQSCIKITLLHYNAAGEDTKNLNDEWVEITNTCSDTIDLSGWLLKDSSAKNSYTFNAISLAMGSHVVLHSGCGMNTVTDLYWQCPTRQNAIWNNTGDEAMLFDTHGKLLSVYKY